MRLNPKYKRYLLPAGGILLPWLLVIVLPEYALWVTAYTNALAWLIIMHDRQALRERLGRLRGTVGKLGIALGSDDTDVMDSAAYSLDIQSSIMRAASGESAVKSEGELAVALERIVSLAHQALNAASTQLALWNSEDRLFHSALTIGTPRFTVSGGADEFDSHETEDIGIIRETIYFAGETLGILRVVLPERREPLRFEKALVHYISLQAGLAIVNSRFSSDLLRMKKESDESVRAKTGFLANLSHELRGPIGIILNSAELVLDGIVGEISSEQREILDMVKLNSSHLLELMSDVLDYAKAEAGKVQPKPESLNLCEILPEVSMMLRAQADAKRHKFICRPVPPGLHVRCDRRHLRQIIINVLTNAFKYTPDGGLVEIWAERMPHDRIKISVRDNGVGISEDQRTKVFSAFERVEHEYSMRQPGTGLGMPLTKILSEKNGGSLDFASMPGLGSTFWIVLEAAEPIDAKRSIDVAPVPTDIKGASVVYIEGDESETRIFERHLTGAGFTFHIMKSPSDIAVVPEIKSTSLIIFDHPITSSDLSGAIRLLRSYPDVGNVPILVLTSDSFKTDIEKYLRAGADRCLSKPISLNELTKTCVELLRVDTPKTN